MASLIGRETAVDCFLVLGVQILSVLDLIFTVVHIVAGGWELNPLMALALKGGYASFGIAKMGITTASLAILVVHIRLVHIRFVLALLFVIYSTVCGYQLYHIFGIG